MLGVPFLSDLALVCGVPQAVVFITLPRPGSTCAKKREDGISPLPLPTRPPRFVHREARITAFRHFISFSVELDHSLRLDLESKGPSHHL
jgi:hypothetical protein